MSVSTRGLVLLTAGSIMASSSVAAVGQVVRPSASRITLVGAVQETGQERQSTFSGCWEAQGVVTPTAALRTAPAQPSCELAAVDLPTLVQPATVATTAASSALQEPAPVVMPVASNSRVVVPLLLGLVALVAAAALIMSGDDDAQISFPSSPD